MLEFAHRFPEAPRDGAPLVVLLHGRGSDERDLLALKPHLPAEVLLVTPRAPFSGAAWGYGPGWAWYRYLGEDRPDPESFTESQEHLTRFLEVLPEHLPVRPGKVILGGFSQGGTMSLGFALRSPGVVPDVLVLSGFLPDHPEVPVTPGSVAGTRFFWGHGTHDPNIPLSLAHRGWARLREAGARLDAREYPMGHSIHPQEMEEIAGWVQG